MIDPRGFIRYTHLMQGWALEKAVEKVFQEIDAAHGRAPRKEVTSGEVLLPAKKLVDDVVTPRLDQKQPLCFSHPRRLHVVPCLSVQPGGKVNPPALIFLSSSLVDSL